MAFKAKRPRKALLACAIAAVCVGSFNAPAAFAASDNLALNKAVTVSAAPEASLPAKALTDGDIKTRWSAETKPVHWAYVDLDKPTEISRVKLTWEKATEYAVDFNIYVSNDKDQWGAPAKAVTGNKDEVSDITLDAPKTGRYVKLEVTKVSNYPSVSCREMELYATAGGGTTDPEAPKAENLALNKKTKASADYDKVDGARAVDGKKKDGKTDRWRSEEQPVQWLRVDLGKVETIKHFNIAWEDSANYAKKFKVYVSDKDAVWNAQGDSTKDWGEPVVDMKDNTKGVNEITLEKPAKGRYVLLRVEQMSTSYGVSCMEFEAWNEAPKAPGQAQDPAENVAHGMTGDQSDFEGGTDFKANKLFDGNTTDKNSRWASEADATAAEDGGPHWVYVDLGQERDVKTVRLFWEQRKAKGYKIQVANGDKAPAAAADAWQTVWESGKDARPASKTETITLDKVHKARYVRLYIDKNTYKDPDNGVDWGTVALYEMEVYGGAPKVSMTDILGQIVVTQPKAGDTQLKYELPTVEGYEVKYNGTDYEQVIGAKGEIFQPISDVTVKASFKITSKSDKKEYAFREVDVTVPGTMKAPESANVAPTILPELREWVGGAGAFKAAAAKRVLYSDASLKPMADEFAADFRAVTGIKLAVEKGSSANTGDILFTLTDDASKGLQDEGYLVDAKADKVIVTAEKVAGANWGAKTILQGMKTGEGSFPVGTARDYPLYKVRGLILDVGRKTFTLDWLQQMTKQMAWFKLNDFHVHLNDNYIPLGEYTGAGKDVFQAYNGFRLESDVKKGGDGGKNQADLTAKDVWYSKKDFKAFMEESAALGVNIIPEIDTPAHSLSLTKVRPDLRHGTNGTQNDHLNLIDRYDESLRFVTGIFDEYLKGGEDSVFASTDVVHIGADEYNADHDAYRRFVNDMFRYTEKNGKTPRVWGSLTTLDGSVEVSGVSESGQHRQMNLWNSGWADMKSMYELGFDLIDCQDGVFYIVPNATYYYDYLGDAAYTDPLNGISGFNIPAGDPQILGGSFAVWNDMCDNQENGMSEYDIYDRIDRSAGLFGANGWGRGSLDTGAAKQVVAKLGDAPNTDFGYDVALSESGAIAQWNMDDLSDASGMKRDLAEGKNAKIEKVDGRSALKLNGEKSYVSVKDDALTTIGLDNDLRVKVKRTSASTEPQVLFESEYGQIMAVQGKTGKVGITRENRAYSFDYALPVNDWVELEFKNRFEQVELWVNGKLVDTLGTAGNSGRGKLKATTMFPVNTIGSKTARSFEGYVDDVRISTAAEFNSTMELDYAVINAETVLKSQKIDGMRDLLNQAYEVFKQPAPDAKVVSDLAAKINALLEKADYAKADYCRIDAYAQLQGGDAAEALADMFTDDSVACLQSVWGKVRRDLPASMQSTVNGYEAELVRALDALKPKPNTDLSLIDPATLEAKDSSHQGGDDASKTLDGNLSSMWHSDWGITAGEHSVTLTSKAPMDVDGIQYTPRQTGTNGNLEKYRIEVSRDGKDFTEIAKGDLKVNGTAPIMIKFDRQDGVKAVKLVWVKGANGNGAAAELRLSDAAAEPNFDRLRDIIAAAEGVKKDGACKHDTFTDATWDAMQAKLAEAKKVLDSGTKDVNLVYKSAQDLATSVVALRLDGDSVPAPDPDKPVNPEKPMKPNKPGDQQKPSGQQKPGTSGNLAQTGDNSMAIIGGVALVAVVALVAGIVMSRRNKR